MDEVTVYVFLISWDFVDVFLVWTVDVFLVCDFEYTFFRLQYTFL